ncbi:MAG: hypothetical protein IKK93_00720 [Campylobacter sp.]|nr:hypothetical protein [Campylobacter sp.]
MDIVNYFESPKPNYKKLAKRLYTKALIEDIKTKPETEQKCFKYQYEYFMADSAEERAKAWTSLFQILLDYSKSLILKKLKSKTFLEPEEVYEKALQATTTFLSCYIINYNFYVSASFAGYLNYKIIEVLYRPKNEDKTLSLNFSFNSSDTEYSFIDDKERFNVQQLYGNNDSDKDPSYILRASPYGVLQGILEDYEDVVGNNALLCKALLYLELCLKKPRNRHIKEQYLKNIAKSKKELNAIEMLELEYVKRLKENYIDS